MKTTRRKPDRHPTLTVLTVRSAPVHFAAAALASAEALSDANEKCI